jgi:prepilin-type N-terminal cleavage/methylation domain-containing protein
MRRSERGVTLIEMIAVVAIIGLIAAITFPSIGSGLESVRMTAAANSVVAFLNAGLNRAERNQQPLEIVVSIAGNNIAMQAPDPKPYARSMQMPEGVTIVRVHPPMQNGAEEAARAFFVHPGGTVPRIGIELANRRGVRRIVRVDPITGIPRVEPVPEQED